MHKVNICKVRLHSQVLCKGICVDRKITIHPRTNSLYVLIVEWKQTTDIVDEEAALQMFLDMLAKLYCFFKANDRWQRQVNERITQPVVLFRFFFLWWFAYFFGVHQLKQLRFKWPKLQSNVNVRPHIVCRPCVQRRNVI